MTSVLWNGPGDYDRFVSVDKTEMQTIVDHYADPDAAAWGRDDTFYYLVNDEKRVLTPLRMPSLAFGGQWNDEVPYGKEEVPCRFSLAVISEYRLEKDWRKRY